MGDQPCEECHKGHSTPVNMCATCHKIKLNVK
ncbi:cytochrome c3 family protein [Turicimonas muris]